MKKLVIVCLGTLMVSCGSLEMHNDFSCGVGQGLGCRSVSEVSDIVDGKATNPTLGSQQVEGKPVYDLLSYYEQVEPDSIPEREPEKRIKIWFAPYIDGHDNFVEETVVYSVIKESRWKY